jgi:hypothetical protein
MAEKSELHIVIGADGVVRVKTHGLTGEACMEETVQLEKAVGTVRSREKTREYYKETTKSKTSVRNR